MNSRNWAHRLGALVVGSATCAAALAAFDVNWFTADGGGGASTAGVWSLAGTAGQPDAGPPQSGGGWTLTGGFWPAFAAAPGALTGDLNCDGVVNFKDINPFVLALSNPVGYAAAYPGCNIMNADVNHDGAVNFKDINPFVTLLTTSK